MKQLHNCTECSLSFESKKDLKNHVNNIHEKRTANKSKKGDTSIIDPIQNCSNCSCEEIKIQNDNLKKELLESQNKNLEPHPLAIQTVE